MNDSILKEYTRLKKDTVTLAELIAKYPQEWTDVRNAVENSLLRHDHSTLKEYLGYYDVYRARLQKSRENPQVIASAMPYIIKARLVMHAVEKYNIAIQTGETGRIRFSLRNGYILQKLLFIGTGLLRKPVSLFWFNIWWRFITQKKILMPLVNKKGIYCFYSDRLVKELSKIIGASKCVEIGAGDGTLSKFLMDKGCDITATDDYSWIKYIAYPEFVEKADARAAISKYKPEIVICSWPPPNNPFEKFIFAAGHVKKYIVIGSKHEFASGNYQEYKRQTDFTMTLDQRLSGMVLPRELDNAVYIFERII
jgi:hypothetical protein